jgi:uncharacterized protein YegL
MDRISTASAKVTFKNVEETEGFGNTNLNFISTRGCYCTIQIKAPEQMAIIQDCGHTWHEKCLGKWLSNNSTCPLCRCIVTEISTINRGIEPIEKFIESYIETVKIFGDYEDDNEDQEDEGEFKHPCPILTRQHTQSSRTFNTQEEINFLQNYPPNPPYSFMSALGFNGYITGLSVLPSIPNTFQSINSVENNNGNINNNCIALFSSSFESNGSTLRTLVISSPINDSNKKVNPTDCVMMGDGSGSMHGNPINLLKDIFLKSTMESEEYIRLSIGIFSDSATQLTPLQQVTPENKSFYLSEIRKIEASGGTNYNHGFSLISDIFDEAGILENVNRITIFVTDGQPSDITDYKIIEKMIEKYPMMKLYFITLGGNINASNIATKFLCNRHPNLSIYKHCESLDDFGVFLPTIFADVCNVFATDVKITFENVKPISSKAIMNDDGSWVINIPCIFESSAEQFAFECTSEIPRIKIEYNMNGSIVNLSASQDIEKLLDKFAPWSLMRHINLKVNTICLDNTVDPSKKRKACEEIFSSLDSEKFGEYYQEIYDTLNKRIETIKRLTTRYYDVDNNLDNSILEHSLNEGSTQRSYSVRLAREVSDGRSQFSNETTFENVFDESNLDISILDQSNNESS